MAELEVDSLVEFESATNQAMADPETPERFSPWVEKLNGLIHFAEVEHWTIR